MTEPDREFFLAEYERIGAALLDNESMGEGRTNLYMTLWVAAAGGAVAFVLLGTKTDSLRFLLAAALAGLLMLGISTLARLQQRNLHTDELIDTLVRLRLVLLKGSEKKTLFERTLPWKSELKRRRKISPRSLVFATMILNALIPVMLALSIVDDSCPAIGFAVGCAGFAVECALVWWSNRTAWKERAAGHAEFEKAL